MTSDLWLHGGRLLALTPPPSIYASLSVWVSCSHVWFSAVNDAGWDQLRSSGSTWSGPQNQNQTKTMTQITLKQLEKTLLWTRARSSSLCTKLLSRIQTSIKTGLKIRISAPETNKLNFKLIWSRNVVLVTRRWRQKKVLRFWREQTAASCNDGVLTPGGSKNTQPAAPLTDYSQNNLKV